MKNYTHMNETTAVEDLMREHGLLNRILIIYDEIIRRHKTNEYIDNEIVLTSAYIIRTFVEDYHEKMEEDYVFPVFIEKNVFVDLINELRNQHELGRKLTDEIINQSLTVIKVDNAEKIVKSMLLFNQMYRIHEAREDTIVFPEFKKLITKKYYEELGEKFEHTEEQIFGEDGFEKNLKIVELIEKKLNIFDIKKPSNDVKYWISKNST